MAITVESVVKKQTREFIRFPYTPAELELHGERLEVRRGREARRVP
jgi:hypothetical protein